MKVNWFANECQRQQAAIALMAAGLCPEPDQQRANRHLSECAGCRAYFRELTAITGAITGLKQSAAQAVPSAALRTRWTGQIQDRPAEVRSPERAGWLTAPAPWLTWGLATAACVLAAFCLGYWHGRTAPGDPLENARLVRETLAMFPHRIQAIVEDEHGLNLVLSDHDDIPSSAPLYVHVCDGRHCSSYLTFSGQEITVAGQKITVLEDAHGGVILAGQAFVWSNAGRTEAGDHWQIQAKKLNLAAM